MPPRKGLGKKPATPRRLKGMAKAMEQAGVEWDEKAATRLRQEVSSGPAEITRREERDVKGQDAPSTDWMPVSALIAMFGVGGLGYFVGESALAPYPHPSHWIAAAMAGSIGYVGGFIWYRMRSF